MMGLSFPAMRYSLGKERRVGRHIGEKIYDAFFYFVFASVLGARLFLDLRVSLAKSWLTDFRQPTNSGTRCVGRFLGPARIYKNWANFQVFWIFYTLTFAKTNFSGSGMF